MIYVAFGCDCQALLDSCSALVWLLVVEKEKNASSEDLVLWFLVHFPLSMEIVHIFQKVKISISVKINK